MYSNRFSIKHAVAFCGAMILGQIAACVPAVVSSGGGGGGPGGNAGGNSTLDDALTICTTFNPELTSEAFNQSVQAIQSLRDQGSPEADVRAAFTQSCEANSPVGGADACNQCFAAMIDATY